MSDGGYCTDCGVDFHSVRLIDATGRPVAVVECDGGCGYCEDCCICWDRTPSD